MSFFNLFKKNNTMNQVQEYLKKGAVILDVRTKLEWDEGHSEGAKHIVLSTIPLNVEEIKSWNKPVIAVCKSGGRSGQAARFLTQHGLDVINGGPWQHVDQFLS
jgi:rhodanese-related sulfurtransferase